MSVYCVPLYDSLGDNAIEYIVRHSESTIIFTSSEKFPALVSALPNVASLVKTVVYWGGADSDATKGAEAIKATKALGINVYSFGEFLELGRTNPAEPVPPKPEDLCTIMYTSGTTGDPKVRTRSQQSVVWACTVRYTG